MVQASESLPRSRELLTSAAATEPAAGVVGALFDVMTTMRRRYSDTSGTSMILTRLAAGGPQRSIDLAESTSLDQSTISRHVAQLGAAGLVERTPVAQDRRAHLLGLTPLGATTAHELIAAKVAYLESILAEWDESDVQTFATLLARFAHGLVTTEGNTAT
jgi:DNA-binding MarR family transcriptional regulator